MQGSSKKKRGALIAGLVIIGLMAVFIGVFILLLKGEEETGANGILIVYIAFFAAIIIGVIAALKQRFGEISSGEEDEAKKY